MMTVISGFINFKISKLMAAFFLQENHLHAKCYIVGYPADLIEKWRDAVYEIEYKKNGDKWQFSFNSTVGEESMQKNYEFESGKEVTSTDTFGKGLTVCNTF